jgi:hypothetical protein
MQALIVSRITGQHDNEKHTATFDTSAEVCESWHPEIMWTSALMAFLACSNALLMIVCWDHVNVWSKYDGRGF